MSAKAARLLLELFRMLDFHCKMCLNDIQFCTFMRFASDMSRHKIYQVTMHPGSFHRHFPLIMRPCRPVILKTVLRLTSYRSLEFAVLFRKLR